MASGLPLAFVEFPGNSKFDCFEMSRARKPATSRQRNRHVSAYWRLPIRWNQFEREQRNAGGGRKAWDNPYSAFVKSRSAKATPGPNRPCAVRLPRCSSPCWKSSRAASKRQLFVRGGRHRLANRAVCLHSPWHLRLQFPYKLADRSLEGFQVEIVKAAREFSVIGRKAKRPCYC